MDQPKKLSNQQMAIIAYLRAYGSITTIEAVTGLGICRLASRISELKKLGYPIAKRTSTFTTKDNTHGSYAVYFLEE